MRMGDRPAADAALAELIDKDRNVMAYQGRGGLRMARRNGKRLSSGYKFPLIIMTPAC
jgi:hypothetical protein